MNLIIKYILTIFLLSGFHLGYAQSLSELINTALVNNYQLQVVKNELLKAENNNTAGNAGQLPTVSFDGTVSTSLNNTYLQFSDESITEGKNAQTSNISLGVMANWTVFSGFSILAKKEQLNKLVELGQVNSAYYIEQTVADIVTAYYQVIFQKQLLSTYASAMQISSYRLQLEKAKKKVGSGTIQTYGQAFVDYRVDSINYIKQLNLIESLEININQLINTNLNQTLKIEDQTFDNSLLLNQDSILSQAKNQNKALAQGQILQQIEETQLRMSKAQRYPTIGLFAGYNLNNNVAEVGFIQQNRNLGPQIGVSISYNLFKGGQNNTAIKNSELDLKNSSLEIADIEQTLNAEIMKFYKEYQSLSKQLILADENRNMMQAVYKVAAAQLKEGSINGYDFRQTQLNLLNAEQSRIQIKYAQKLIEINLNQITGKIVNAYI